MMRSSSNRLGRSWGMIMALNRMQRLGVSLWVDSYHLSCVSSIQRRQSNKIRSSHARCYCSSSSSSFQPNVPPPGTFGTPVFPNVELLVDPPNHRHRRNDDSNAVFVVTGASRGIGLECVQQLLQRSKGSVVACCRTPETALTLQQILQQEASQQQQQQQQQQRLHVLSLDLECQESIENAGAWMRDKFHRVDMLLNVAGLLGDGKTTPGPERSLSKMDRDWLEKTLAVNVVGPVMWTKELLPLLTHRRSSSLSSSKQQNPNDMERPLASVVASLSARVGSLSDNQLGGWYSYRMSKAALNQFTRTMALELKRHHVWCISLHPGTTDTDLSKPFQANVRKGKLFPVDFTVSQLLNVIDSLTDAHSGGFYDWAGKSISF